MDAHFSYRAQRALDESPDRNDAEGYTTVAGEGQQAGRSLICKRCFDDFAADFEWVVLKTDPEAWPYAGPEPNPRPTAGNFTGVAAERIDQAAGVAPESPDRSRPLKAHS